MHETFKRAVAALMKNPSQILIIESSTNGHLIKARETHKWDGGLAAVQQFNHCANTAVQNISLAFPGRVLWGTYTRGEMLMCGKMRGEPARVECTFAIDVAP